MEGNAVKKLPGTRKKISSPSWLYRRLLFPLCGALLLFTSCGEIRASYRVTLGNYAYSRGDYQNANIQYIRAAELEEETPIITYNLGTVYQALGEVQSAMEQWEEMDPAGDDMLAFRFLYNRGILYYQTGNYQEAYEGFREALIHNPASLDAKINLEHSLRKLNAQEQSSPAAAPVSRAEGSPEEIQRVLDYIRRTETIRPPVPPAAEEVSGENDW